MSLYNFFLVNAKRILFNLYIPNVIVRENSEVICIPCDFVNLYSLAENIASTQLARCWKLVDIEYKIKLLV